ncbi:MAG: hypothetical protein E7157_02610 [Lactobacillales bacterium]|nr:hypothetical protein [Lactobacillales bacterium]
MKKVLSLSITMLLVLGLVTGCGCNKKEKEEKKEEIKVNTNKDVVKDQEVDGIKMTNTSLVTTNGISKLVTNVTNNSDKDYKLDEYMIIIKDKEGKEIVRIPGYVGDTIKAGETRTINSSVDRDLSNAGSIEYEVKK